MIKGLVGPPIKAPFTLGKGLIKAPFTLGKFTLINSKTLQIFVRIGFDSFGRNMEIGINPNKN